MTSEKRYRATKDEWPEPQRPRVGLQPVPQLSEDMLPEPLRSFVVDIGQRLSLPLDMPAVCALTMLGASIGRSIQIQPQTHSEWTQPPNLWTCIVANAGWMKSPTINEALKPLTRVQHTFNEAYKQDMLEYAAADRAYKRQIGAAKKSGDDPGDPPEKPAAKRLYSHDASWEGLHKTMGENPKGLMLITDELAKLWESLELTGAEKTKGFFLSAWNGNQEISLDRIIRGNPTAIVCLSQLGGCQPSLLRDYVRGMTGDGWLQRYGLLVYPNLNQPYVVNKTPPNVEATEAVNEMVAKFARMEPGPIFKTVRFAATAQQLYEDWSVRLNNRNRTNLDGQSDTVISAFSKYQTLFPQLALLFALCVDPETELVHQEQVELAERWCSEYCAFHVRRVYGLIHPGGVGVETLAEAIEHRKIIAPFTARDVQRKNWRGLGDKRDVQDALDVLIDLGWIRAQNHDYGKQANQTTTRYRINPRVFLKMDS